MSLFWWNGLLGTGHTACPDKVQVHVTPVMLAGTVSTKTAPLAAPGPPLTTSTT